MNKKEIDFVVSIIDNIPLLKVTYGSEKHKPEYRTSFYILRSIDRILNMTWTDFMHKYKSNNPKANKMTQLEIDFLINIIIDVSEGNWESAKLKLSNFKETIGFSWVDFKRIYQTKDLEKLTLKIYKEITATEEGKKDFDKWNNAQLDDLMQKMLEQDD